MTVPSDRRVKTRPLSVRSRRRPPGRMVGGAGEFFRETEVQGHDAAVLDEEAV